MPWIRTTWAVLWSARSNAPAEDQSDMAPTRPNAAATTAATKASTRIRPGVPSRALLMALRERETAGVDAPRDGTGVSSTTSAPAAADGAAVALLMSLLQPVALVGFVGFVDAARRRPRVTFRRLRPALRFPHRARIRGATDRLRVGQ